MQRKEMAAQRKNFYITDEKSCAFSTEYLPKFASLLTVTYHIIESSNF